MFTFCRVLFTTWVFRCNIGSLRVELLHTFKLLGLKQFFFSNNNNNNTRLVKQQF